MPHMLALFFFAHILKLMTKITYIQHNKKSQSIDVANGLSLMEGAIQNNISGIDADCGGSMACATCHVYIDKKWFDKLKKKDEGEEDMLDMACLLYTSELPTILLV